MGLMGSDGWWIRRRPKAAGGSPRTASSWYLPMPNASQQRGGVLYALHKRQKRHGHDNVVVFTNHPPSVRLREKPLKGNVNCEPAHALSYRHTQANRFNTEQLHEVHLCCCCALDGASWIELKRVQDRITYQRGCRIATVQGR